MRQVATVLAGFALAFAAAVQADPPFSIITPSASLSTTASDDMRPEIVGVVEGVGASEVELVGGPRVPVAAAPVKVGQHVTFACASIKPGPVLAGCELKKETLW